MTSLIWRLPELLGIIAEYSTFDTLRSFRTVNTFCLVGAQPTWKKKFRVLRMRLEDESIAATFHKVKIDWISKAVQELVLVITEESMVADVMGRNYSCLRSIVRGLKCCKIATIEDSTMQEIAFQASVQDDRIQALFVSKINQFVIEVAPTSEPSLPCDLTAQQLLCSGITQVYSQIAKVFTPIYKYHREHLGLAEHLSHMPVLEQLSLNTSVDFDQRTASIFKNCPIRYPRHVTLLIQTVQQVHALNDLLSSPYHRIEELSIVLCAQDASPLLDLQDFINKAEQSLPHLRWLSIEALNSTQAHAFDQTLLLDGNGDRSLMFRDLCAVVRNFAQSSSAPHGMS